MEGYVNRAGGGEPGNQLPPIRRRPTAPQPRGRGFAPSPRQKQIHQLPGGRGEHLSSLGRKPMPSRQPRRTPVYAHQDDGHGHESGYGNTHDEQQGHAMPHHRANHNPNSRENGRYQYAEGNHYNGATTDQYRQAGCGVAHPNYDASLQQAEAHDYGAGNVGAGTHGQPNVKSRGYEVEEQQENQPNAHQDDGYGQELGYENMYNEQQGHAMPNPYPYPNPNPDSRENGGYQYAEGNHYHGATTDQCRYSEAGYGVAHPNYDASLHEGHDCYEAEHGQPNVKSSGYGVEEQGGRENEPNEKCMQCVHGIAVPIARLSTRTVFKGTRCIACMCTIL